MKENKKEVERKNIVEKHQKRLSDLINKYESIEDTEEFVLDVFHSNADFKMEPWADLREEISFKKPNPSTNFLSEKVLCFKDVYFNLIRNNTFEDIYSRIDRI